MGFYAKVLAIAGVACLGIAAHVFYQRNLAWLVPPACEHTGWCQPGSGR